MLSTFIYIYKFGCILSMILIFQCLLKYFKMGMDNSLICLGDRLGISFTQVVNVHCHATSCENKVKGNQNVQGLCFQSLPKRRGASCELLTPCNLLVGHKMYSNARYLRVRSGVMIYFGPKIGVLKILCFFGGKSVIGRV